MKPLESWEPLAKNLEAGTAETPDWLLTAAAELEKEQYYIHSK